MTADMPPGGCLVPGCTAADLDPDRAVVCATTQAPYRVPRRACTPHLDKLAAIGLPLVPVAKV